MLFFKGKEDMGLEASLKLLDLPPDATIDDANQAYTHLHRMIDQFHQDAGVGKRGDRQEDIDLLVFAYEKAVAHLSDRDPQHAPSLSIAPPQSSVDDRPSSTDLHLTINMLDKTGKDPSSGDVLSFPEPNARTVKDAISITSRRLHQTESALPAAQQAVESATAAVLAANRRHDQAKQASLTAAVAAMSGKNRVLLLDIEVKRARQEAIAVAKKARERVAAAKQAAEQASTEADKARKRASRVKKSEETAAAEVICAEDRLEKEKGRLKALVHALVEARSRIRMFHDAGIATEKPNTPVDVHKAVKSDVQYSSTQPAEGEAATRQQIMSDLLEIESSLKDRKRDPMPTHANRTALSGASGRNVERRQHPRVIYPVEQCPKFSIDGHRIPILDLSTVGMRLEPNAAMTDSRIVRGIIKFHSRPPMKVTGKVIRQDDAGLGLKLVTRIGNHLLDHERLRLRA